MNQLKNKLFTDRFCPKNFDSFVLPERIKEQLKGGLITHTLLYGSHGIGKTSISRLLIKDMPHLEINAAEEGRMDVLRNKIHGFCTDVQLDLDESKVSDYKAVFLNEIDGVSPAFFDALKGFMDEFGEEVRFIATSNYINKIPSPIQSRFQGICFDPRDKEEEEEIRKGYMARIYAIIQKIGMSCGRQTLEDLTDRHFPDFRGALQDLQRLHNAGHTNIELDKLERSGEMEELFELILSGDAKPEQIHSHLMGSYAHKADEVLSSLDGPFISYIEKNYPGCTSMIPNVCIEVADHQEQMNKVIDPALAMKACVFKLSKIAKEAKK